MESFLSRFRNALVLLAVLVAQTVGLAVQVRRPAASENHGHEVYLLRLWANAAVGPVERLTHHLGLSVRGTWWNYIDLRRTRQQNDDLRREIAALRLEQASFAQDAVQGHRLQALLDFRQHYISRTVAAQVIGTSGSDLARLLMIDKGVDAGLKPDMAVITPDGVVGKLREVFPHTAQLLLLNDPTSGAGVLLQASRIRAVVRGTATGRLQIANLTADARIKPGETVLTSGGDLVFPRGLPVGTIESVGPDPDHQPYSSILLKPAANLAQLEEVLVVTEMQMNVPAQAQEDLAQGVATAEILSTQAAEAKRAADLLSEKLPSLHEVTPAAAVQPQGTVAPVEASDTGAIPRPLPTLHADRYTAGSTPPATLLTPGAKAASESVPSDDGSASKAPVTPVGKLKPKPPADVTTVPLPPPSPATTEPPQ